MSRPSLLDGQAAHQHCDTQSSDTRKDSEARELTPEVTTPVCEQKRKLNDLYVKIGRLWEENDALKENITALKEQELCDECKAKDTMIAQLEEQLYSTAAVRPKNDPDPDGDAAQSGLRIAFFKAEEQLRTSNLEHAAEIARIKEEHKIIASRLHEELCAARTTAKEEQTERVHTQRQLSDTKRQLLDSEKQYQIFYDAIPKPGGCRMTRSPLPIMSQSTHSGEADGFSSWVPPSSRLEPTERSHGSRSQNHEAFPTPLHDSNGSQFSQDQDTLNGAEIARTCSVREPSHEIAQDQSRTQRSSKRKKTSPSIQIKPLVSSAEEIPWLFCVSGAGEVSYHTLDELFPNAQKEVEESFQYYFSARNDAEYDSTEAIHHNTYANMVRGSNRLANAGRGCVQSIVIARGSVSKNAKQTGECEACGVCQRKGCPCAKVILHNGNLVLCFYRHGTGASSGATWKDAAYWIS